MTRVLRTELRRSAAAPLLLLALALNGALLQLRSTHWEGTVAGVTSTAKSNLLLLLPLTLAAAVWHGGRERRAGMEELVSTAARPVPEQRLPSALALVLAVLLGVGLTTAAAAAQVAADGGYTGGRWALSAALLVLALAVAVAVGLAVGRVVHVPFAAPLVAIGVAMVLLLTSFGAAAELNPAGDPAQAFTQLRSSAAGAQAVLLAGLLVAGLMAAFAASARVRALAALPAIAGIAAGALVANGAGPYEPDAAAATPVCAQGEPRVCVTRLDQHLLAQVVGPARAVLRRAALLPGAPTSAQEVPLRFPLQDPKVLAVPELRNFSLHGGEAQLRSIIGYGEAERSNGCEGAEEPTKEQSTATGLVGAWLAGSPLEGAGPASDRAAYDQLVALPLGEQVRKVSGLRQALQDCSADPLQVLR